MRSRPHRIDRPSFAALHAAVALGGVLGVADRTHAQTGDDLPPPLPIRQVTIDPVGFPSPPYTPRYIGEVYDNLTATFGNGSSTHLGTCSQIVEDISFVGGPWNASDHPTSRVISEITYGAGLIINNSVGEDILLIFWDEDDLDFQGIGGPGNSMIRPNATPLAVVREDSTGLNAPFYWQVTANLTGLPGGGVAVPNDDNGLALQVAWVTDAFTPPDTNGDTQPNWENLAGGVIQGCASATDKALVFGSQSGAAVGGNADSPGTTLVNYGRDISNTAMCSHIGVFLGAANPPAAAGNIENRFINATPQRGYMVRLKGNIRGDGNPCPPPLRGPIPDAGVVFSTTILPSYVHLYCVEIAGDATDAARQFLDIDTENSATDASLALWDGASGSLLAVNDDDGSGSNAQLSFGIGIRPRIGEGTQYNGRHGELFTNRPTYYLGVGTGPPGATTYGGGLSRSSTGPGGPVTIRVATNTNGTPLAPSVAPDTVVPPLNAGLPLAAPGARPPLGTIAARSALWYEFRVCDIANPARYLDIHTNDTVIPPNTLVDTELFLFNDIGQLLAADDDSGTEFLSQLSFGHAGPRPAPGNGEPYAGQHGSLAAGRYFLALALFDTTAPGTRWHVRAQSNGTAVAQLALVTDSPGFCPRCHGPCVADFDDGSGTGMPDGGVTIDDLLYYLRLFEDGSSCADVDDGTFTNTPDGGVTIDDLLYYLFRFEAGC